MLRSPVNAAKTALRKMGVNASPDELDTVASGFIEELELVNSRPIDPDMLAIFFDGKYVEIKEDERLRPACIYLVTGLHRDGRKKVPGLFHKTWPRKPRGLENRPALSPWNGASGAS